MGGAGGGQEGGAVQGGISQVWGKEGESSAGGRGGGGGIQPGVEAMSKGRGGCSAEVGDSAM